MLEQQPLHRHLPLLGRHTKPRVVFGIQTLGVVKDLGLLWQCLDMFTGSQLEALGPLHNM